LGSAVLRAEACARVVVAALLHDNQRKYELHAWCVMPNHVRVMALIAPSYELGAVVREWKTITARRINAVLGQRGAVWARDYFDRFVRDHDHYLAVKEYIERNPVASGLQEARGMAI
jgi:REP element-mobilizing transposase RayT